MRATASGSRRARGRGCSPPATRRGRRARSGRHSKEEVSPDEEWFGRVVWANPVLRFVVMDFPVLKMPPVDQRLNVYHRGQKVGEVKVTGPMRDTTIAGDIITGEAEVGDEVREQ